MQVRMYGELISICMCKHHTTGEFRGLADTVNVESLIKSERAEKMDQRSHDIPAGIS
jgi:hypothetical protein